MNWPDLTVMIVTYNRPREIRRTTKALEESIVYPGQLHWHLADDASPGTYIQDLHQDFSHLKFSATSTNRQGWGANVNKALKFIRDDYTFLCEDDYVAVRQIKLHIGVRILEAQPTIGLIRYDGIAGHLGLNLWLREARTPIGTLSYLEIDRGHSGHLNVYSNRPHLRHRRFQNVVGYYPEGISLGHTEEAYAHKVIDAKPGMGLAILSDGIGRAFDHIGKSRQGTKLDRP